MTAPSPRVPVADPARLAAEEAHAVRAAMEAVLTGGSWILGETVADFEAAFAAYVGAPEGAAVGVGNGTDALVLAFLALGLPAGAAVLVADDEGGYAASAATQVGLRVRVMDVDPHTGSPSTATAAAADAPDVAALVVTHLHGDAVQLDGGDGLDAWRRGRGLALVEDCAQAHGLRVAGNHVGGTGDAATFSFYPTKNLGAVGDAGAVVLREAHAAARARSLRQYGWGERHRIETPHGRNSRLDALQAAVLQARLPFLDDRNARRRAIAGRYRELVTLHGDRITTVAHHAVALVDHRDRVRSGLAAVGVDTAVHYPWLVSEMPGLDVPAGTTPGAAARRDRVLSLPCFPELRDGEVDRVCAALARVLAQVAAS